MCLFEIIYTCDGFAHISVSLIFIVEKQYEVIEYRAAQTLPSKKYPVSKMDVARISHGIS